MCFDQERQIGVLAAEDDVLNREPVLTPMSAHFDLAEIAHTHTHTHIIAASAPFRQLVGALLWIGRHTHPEIMQPVVCFA